MILFDGINFLAVFVSAVVYFMIGFVWYSVLFGELWGKETGTSGQEKPKPGALAGQFISTFIFALGIAILLKLNGIYGVSGGMYAAALVTVFFAIPINSGNFFFTGKKKLFLLDVCERAIGSLVVGIILGLWR
jgi:Protein of unknown function (DUF1761)